MHGQKVLGIPAGKYQTPEDAHRTFPHEVGVLNLFGVCSALCLQAMKAFIETTFRMIDVDGDGVVGQTEFVLNCITRIAVDDVKLIQEAYQKLLNVRTLI